MQGAPRGVGARAVLLSRAGRQGGRPRFRCSRRPVQCLANLAASAANQWPSAV